MTFSQQIIKSKQAEFCISELTNAKTQTDYISSQEDEIKALNHALEYQPQYILLAYDVKKSATTEFISFLLSASSQSRILVIGLHVSEQQILSCLAAGAKGYIEYHSVEKYLDKAISVITHGEAWVSRKMATVLFEYLRLNCSKFKPAFKISPS